MQALCHHHEAAARNAGSLPSCLVCIHEVSHPCRRMECCGALKPYCSSVYNHGFRRIFDAVTSGVREQTRDQLGLNLALACRLAYKEFVTIMQCLMHALVALRAVILASDSHKSPSWNCESVSKNVDKRALPLPFISKTSLKTEHS